MPIYEYRCNSCRRKVTLLIQSSSTKLMCSHCSSSDLSRIFSRFAVPRSEETRLESLADPCKWDDIDENDPSSIARFMKKMGKEFGDELGEDFEQEVESAAEEASHGDDTTEETASPKI